MINFQKAAQYKSAAKLLIDVIVPKEKNFPAFRRTMLGAIKYLCVTVLRVPFRSFSRAKERSLIKKNVSSLLLP